MAHFNTALAAMLIVALAVWLTNTTAHHSSDDDSTSDIPLDDAIATLINDVYTPKTLPNDEALTTIINGMYGSDFPTTLPADEASAKAPSSGVVFAPFPFNFAPIIDDIVTSIPVDEEQKDNMFIEKYLQIAAGNTQTFLSDVLQKKLEEKAAAGDECAAICEQVMLSANDALNHGLVSIGAKEYFSADVEIRAFSSNIETCIQCYGDSADPELLKFINWATGVSDACLGKIDKHSDVSFSIIPEVKFH